MNIQTVLSASIAFATSLSETFTLSVPGRVHTVRTSASLLLRDFNTAGISLLDQSATVRLDSHPTDMESD